MSAAAWRSARRPTIAGSRNTPEPSSTRSSDSRNCRSKTPGSRKLVAEAKWLAKDHHYKYNHIGPRSQLGYKAPAKFAASCLEALRLTATPIRQTAKPTTTTNPTSHRTRPEKRGRSGEVLGTCWRFGQGMLPMKKVLCRNSLATRGWQRKCSILAGELKPEIAQ